MSHVVATVQASHNGELYFVCSDHIDRRSSRPEDAKLLLLAAHPHHQRRVAGVWNGDTDPAAAEADANVDSVPGIAARLNSVHSGRAPALDANSDLHATALPVHGADGYLVDDVQLAVETDVLSIDGGASVRDQVEPGVALSVHFVAE